MFPFTLCPMYEETVPATTTFLATIFASAPGDLSWAPSLASTLRPLSAAELMFPFTFVPMYTEPSSSFVAMTTSFARTSIDSIDSPPTEHALVLSS